MRYDSAGHIIPVFNCHEILSAGRVVGTAPDPPKPTTNPKDKP